DRRRCYLPQPSLTGPTARDLSNPRDGRRTLQATLECVDRIRIQMSSQAEPLESCIGQWRLACNALSGSCVQQVNLVARQVAQLLKFQSCALRLSRSQEKHRDLRVVVLPFWVGCKRRGDVLWSECDLDHRLERIEPEEVVVSSRDAWAVVGKEV